MSKGKYEAYRKISSLKAFEYSNADRFKLDGKTVSRGELENMTVKALKAFMARGALYTARIKPERKAE